MTFGILGGTFDPITKGYLDVIIISWLKRKKMNIKLTLNILSN
jgi:phosphopantetheine adenylyltransferase